MSHKPMSQANAYEMPHGRPHGRDRTHRILLASTIACACMAFGPVRADQDAEREELARISYELQRVQMMVAQASRQAPTGQRINFRYDWLARDLDLMRRGVEEHLDAPTQPRTVTPLRGDYRR